ncbi:hypothetical protein ABPG77_008540 [Micractinium sp. CCAP 211/92]
MLPALREAAARLRLPTILQPGPGLAVVPAAAAACSRLPAGCWFPGYGPSGVGAAPAVTLCDVTAAGSTTAGSSAAEDLGDLKPGKQPVHAHVHRRRLKLQEEHHLDEEEPPAEEAPGEEAYKEAGPLLPPDSEEEDIVTDEEEEARNAYVWRPPAGTGMLPEAVPMRELPLSTRPWPEVALETEEVSETQLDERAECAG